MQVRRGPGEVAGEQLSNDAAMIFVDDAFKFLSKAESACIDVISRDTPESLLPQLPNLRDRFAFDDTMKCLEDGESEEDGETEGRSW